MNLYLDLFLSFAKVGVCTFGGGYAMLPILQREVVDGKGWATESELADYYAVGQCTPGIIAVNTATFVGAKEKGVPGGIAATLGLIFPCLVIIGVIAAFLSHVADNPWVGHAFAGVPAACRASFSPASSSCARPPSSTQLPPFFSPWSSFSPPHRCFSPSKTPWSPSSPPGGAGGPGWADRAGHPGGKGVEEVILLRLYFEFFRVGLFSVGGGLATIPFLTDLGTRTGWFTPAELANMVAVSESTPVPWG